MEKKLVTGASKEIVEKLASNDLSFSIHSVYNQVLNLKDLNDKLYTITLEDFDNLPATLKINSSQSFKELNISKNDQIFINSNSIKISNKLEINFKKNNFEIWNSKLAPKITLNKENISKNLDKSAAFFLEESSCRGAVYFYLDYYFKVPKENSKDKNENMVEKYLYDEIKNEIIEPALKAKNPSALIGLGMGLTPSGDDFLTGYLGVMGSVDLPSAEKNFNHFKDNLLKNDFSTTDISIAMLKNILNLKSRAKISDFIYAVNKDHKTFTAKFAEILTIGSTSGSDLAVGVLTAYQEILRYL